MNGDSRPRDRFPDRILVADIAHPERDEYELEIFREDNDWGDLPVTTYERAQDEGSREAE